MKKGYCEVKWYEKRELDKNENGKRERDGNGKS